ncbi:MAG: conjugal transfer protein TraX [Defluviitaleaceae bacterium]|nr:conjugal transfer protein TraX [Defluviitaleaceae bacterium]
MEHKGISAFTLKLIAIIGMIAQHTVLALPGVFPFGVEVAANIAGGLTFPILAFFLVEGFRHTSDLSKYKKRILLFAFISFIPHLISLGSGLNIMFQLLFGLMLLEYRRKHGSNAKFWLLFVLTGVLTIIFDWSATAYIVILAYEAIRSEKLRRIVTPVIASVGLVVFSIVVSIIFSLFIDPDVLAEGASKATMFFPLGCLLVIPLLLMYKGKRGPKMKWFFYVIYPVHLLVLGIIAFIMGVGVVHTFIDMVLEGFNAAIGY